MENPSEDSKRLLPISINIDRFVLEEPAFASGSFLAFFIFFFATGFVSSEERFTSSTILVVSFNALEGICVLGRAVG